MAKDYYKILGITRSASDEEVKKAYRRLAQQYHPDKVGGNAEKFKEINEAYQILSDKQKKSQYDQFGTTSEQPGGNGGFGGGGFQDFSDIFDMFGGGRQGGGSTFKWEDVFGSVFEEAERPSAKKRGQDIVIDLTISLEEAARGLRKEIEISKGIVCPHCHGQGAEPGSDLKKCETCKGRGKIEERQRVGFFSVSQVRECPQCSGRGEIPAKKCAKCGGDGRIRERQRLTADIPTGIADNEVIRFMGQGEAGLFGVKPGDLYIKIHVSPHSKFKREGNNLYYQQFISFTQAVLGDKIEVPTLEGNIVLKISAGIESGTVLRLQDKGIKTARGKGDLFIEIRIKTPKRISDKGKKLLEELRKEIE